MASSAPLPPGWEARWDPNQRAFFYIDHSTKKTSWQDPRVGYQQPHAQQYGGFQHHQAAQEQKVDVQKLHMIKQQFPSAPEDVIKRILLDCNNVVVKSTNKLFSMGYKREAVAHHPEPKKDDILERLKAMFPSAPEDIITGVLAGADHDEKQARAMLEGIGFKPNYPQTHKSNHKSPAKSASNSRTTSPARRTPSPKPTSPAKPNLSEAQKKALDRKIHGQFPSYDISVVQMALQVCNYDESRVKAVLDRMGETSLPGKKVPSSRPATSKSSRTRSPSPKPLSPASLEPVSMLDDDFSSLSRPSTSTSTGTTSSSSSKTTVSSRPTSSKTTVKVTSPKKSTASPVRQQQKQQARAKQVTEMSKDILSSTIHTLNNITNNVPCCGRRDLPPSEPANQSSEDSASSQSAAATQSCDVAQQDSARSSRQVVSRQPQQAEYQSEYRTVAKGPDPSLCSGPNKSLLLSDYTLAKGPNPELRLGPDTSRARGSQGAMGPDRSLHCGPEQHLCKGPSSQNLLDLDQAVLSEACVPNIFPGNSTKKISNVVMPETLSQPNKRKESDSSDQPGLPKVQRTLQIIDVVCQTTDHDYVKSSSPVLSVIDRTELEWFHEHLSWIHGKNPIINTMTLAVSYVSKSWGGRSFVKHKTLQGEFFMYGQVRL